MHFINLRSLSTLFALTLSACAFPKVVGDSPLSTSTSTGTSGTATDAVLTDGPAPACGNPAFTCSGPIDCVQWRCGALDSPFDADGCLRPSCEAESCGADEICYSVDQSSDCSAEVLACADVDGACNCELGDCFARHCIPADEGPPVECAGITDEAACLAAGCSEFTTVSLATIVDDACVFAEPTPLCMWFPGDAWGGNATPGAFYKQDTGEAASFPTDWIDPPHGWGDCGDADAPPACGCFSVCTQVQDQAADFLESDQPCADVSDCVLADAVCFAGSVCGTVGVHKDSQAEWDGLEADIDAQGCCSGADPCGSTLACQDSRCVAVFP